MKNKLRLDQLLVEKGFFETRQKAQSAIMAGLVFIDKQRADKAGKAYPADITIEVKGDVSRFVSRGGEKLEHALAEFNINVNDKICIDIGASTGGFTDCLLQHGAKKVYAVDVGRGQLAWKLQNDPRVIMMDKTNARYLTLEDIGEKCALAVIDVSFISLTKILPSVYNLIENHGEVIALIKPQFEASRKQVGKGGIVKDPAVHLAVIEKIKSASEEIGYKVAGIINSPITGADGNIEFLMLLEKT